ncbi:hypothetical protein AB0E01_41820 [Nocardia vinacea]|uniref:hypothetical protein n=1 Tax=Nocardia vinacea TaxID=96468 RepID=UPI0033FD34EC
MPARTGHWKQNADCLGGDWRSGTNVSPSVEPGENTWALAGSVVDVGAKSVTLAAHQSRPEFRRGQLARNQLQLIPDQL